jgi:hypothetical protein
MSLLQRIEDAVARGPHALDELVSTTEFPHVEGRSVTFLFRGEAQEVSLQHWIHGLPGSLPFRRLRHGEAWVLQLDLPPRSRMEYKIGVSMFGRGVMLRDPLYRESAHLIVDTGRQPIEEVVDAILERLLPAPRAAAGGRPAEAAEAVEPEPPCGAPPQRPDLLPTTDA